MHYQVNASVGDIIRMLQEDIPTLLGACSYLTMAVPFIIVLIGRVPPTLNFSTSCRLDLNRFRRFTLHLIDPD